MGNAPVQHVSDRELVIAFQRGEPGAYDEMYRRYQGRVMFVCSRMLGHTHDAEEATQETFLKAYQALPRFNGSYHVGAWLSRIAANVCVDQLRSKSRSRLVALPPEEVLQELGVEEGPEERLTRGDERLRDVISEIQPLHAEALKLRAVDGLSHEEMAGRLAMTPPQVKALLHRARNSFRRAWRKAEGWALAPLFVGRSLFGDRSKDASNAAPNLAGLSSSVSPVLAERVAASAVIVVAALSGLPSVHVADPPPPPREVVQDRLPRMGLGRDATTTTRVVAAAPMSHTGRRASDGHVGSPALPSPRKVTRTVNGILRRSGVDDPRPEGGHQGGKNIGPSAATSQSRELVKVVREKVQELEDLIPPEN